MKATIAILAVLAVFATGCKCQKAEEDAEVQEAEKARRAGEFLKAVEDGDLEKVRELVDLGFDVRSKDSEGNTALHTAAGSGNKELIELLIRLGADVNERGEESKTPLHMAADRNREDAVKLLLEHGANLHARDEKGRQAIHFAATNYGTSLACLLAWHGADKNARDNEGFTPLDYLMTYADCSGSYPETISFEAFHKEGWESGEPHRAEMIWAARKGDMEKMTALRDIGVSGNIRTPDGGTLLGWISVMYSNEEMVRLLLDMGADPNEKSWGLLLLNDAAMYGKAGIVKALVEAGADVNVKDEHGNTPLDYTAVKGDGRQQTAEIIMSKGGKCGKPHRREFFIAVRESDRKKVAELIEKGMNPSEEDVAGQSALYIALGNRSDMLAELLISKGADVNNVCRCSGMPILHQAVLRAAKARVVDLILARGADVNCRNRAGQTALHIAAAIGNAGLAKVLLEHGADTSAVDRNGQKALDLAREHERTATIELLSGAGKFE